MRNTERNEDKITPRSYLELFSIAKCHQNEWVEAEKILKRERKWRVLTKYFKQAESILKKETPKNHYRRAELYFHFGKLKLEMDNLQKSRQYLNTAYEIYLDNFGADSKRTKNVHSLLENISQV